MKQIVVPNASLTTVAAVAARRPPIRPLLHEVWRS